MLDRVRGSAEPATSRWAHACLAVAACILLSACGGTGAPQAMPADLEKIRAAAAAPPQLQAGEKIRVTVFGENSLSGEYQDRSERVRLASAGWHGKGGGSDPERSGAGTRSQPSQRLLEGPESYHLDNRIPPVLHPGRSREAGRLPIFERFERHERYCDRWRHDVPGKPVDGADPACRRRRNACLRRIEIDPHSARRHHPGAAPIFLKSSRSGVQVFE